MLDDALSFLSDALSDDATLATLAILFIFGAIAALLLSTRRDRIEIARRIDDGAIRTGAKDDGAVARVGKVGGAMAEMAARIDSSNPDVRKAFRHRLIQAGFHDPRAVAWFIGARLVSAPAFAMLALALTLWLFPDADTGRLATFAFIGAGLGYVAPSVVLDRRIKRRKEEHVAGFPDFMDLMVVCCQAGLSMEAGINRVARELGLAFPSLASNLDITTLELRGGKSLGAAIEGLSKRLAIDEAVSFATLLTQSEELGSSLTDSLRAYSGDMRNKRLMRAEEKANALPALLVIPLTLFVFPVLMIVILLPVAIGVATV